MNVYHLHATQMQPVQVKTTFSERLGRSAHQTIGRSLIKYTDLDGSFEILGCWSETVL